MCHVCEQTSHRAAELLRPEGALLQNDRFMRIKIEEGR